MSSWIEFRTSDLINNGLLEIGDGYRAKNSELGKYGLPFVRVSNINNGFHFKNSDRFPEENLGKVGAKVSAPGDVVFTSKGTVGRYALVPDNLEPFVYSPQLCYWRSLNWDVIDPHFLYYWMHGREFWVQVRGLKGQTDMADYVSLRDQRRMLITMPAIEEQRLIAVVLSAFDDKIELNRQMNAALEEMARAIYKSWFVDFDPVRAKARGEEPYGMDAETAALFPDRFDVVNGREVPVGWHVKVLGEIVDAIETGSRPKGGIKGIMEGVPSVGAESIVGLGQFDFSKTKFVPRDFFSNMKRGKINDRDILLYKDGGRPGMFEPHVTIFGDGFPFQEFCINSHVYRIRSNPLVCQEYLYFWLDSDWAMMEMRNRATGVAIPGINSTALRQIPIIVPKLEIVRQFARIVKPLLDLIFNNCNESNTHAKLRDALLPRLMSGQLRVAAMDS